jgi:hypothetical protein
LIFTQGEIVFSFSKHFSIINSKIRIFFALFLLVSRLFYCVVD